MMSTEYIRQIADDAARRAARADKTPLVIEKPEDIPHVPFLGDYVPTHRGWRALTWAEVPGDRPRVATYRDADNAATFMVDSSGFGSDWEPALTQDQTIAYVMGVYAATKRNLGLGIVEAGEFQVVFQWYEKEV